MHRWLALLLLFIFPFQSFSAQAQLPAPTVQIVLSVDSATDTYADTEQKLIQQALNEFLDHCEAPPGVCLQHYRQAIKRLSSSHPSQVLPYQHLPERRPPKNRAPTPQHVTTTYFYS
ncbi:hypothetical protein [Alcaligenes endophyticus]|uniref:UrcA family protein n=1 Tax=Alcaligenes endophyticus TaxID=1929088 RepID=A0ABT8ELM2_9BURK|nr:hypothetical protein [Alcaligenes endophyticus]MCX5591249.1 hypothetical protein [Alcaligenes endophyticus]MDN4122173.1 hypothetical protein [Alcaligenes endophyticus]